MEPFTLKWNDNDITYSSDSIINKYELRYLLSPEDEFWIVQIF